MSQEMPDSSPKVNDKMPRQLRELYHPLYTEVSWLHLKWNDFLRLYGANKETVDLLNKVAPQFFHDHQRMMWEDVLLHICRLTDNESVAGKETLSIRRLVGAIPERELRKSISSLVENVVKKTEFIRAIRNRRLAHRELPSQGKGSVKPLPHVSRKGVEEVLDAVRQTMNAVSIHYFAETFGYELAIEVPGGAESLLRKLRRSATQGSSNTGK